MLGLRARLWADLGGYLLTTTPIPPHTAATLITGCYDIAAADVRVRGVRTHKVPTGPYRGAGRPDAAYMLESLVDRAARQLGIDRVTLRRRNLIRRFPHRNPQGLEYDSGDFERCLDLRWSSGADPLVDPGAAIGDRVRDRDLHRARRWGVRERGDRVGDGGRFVIARAPALTARDTRRRSPRSPPTPAGRAGAIELRFGDSAHVRRGRNVRQPLGGDGRLGDRRRRRGAGDAGGARGGVLDADPAAVTPHRGGVCGRRRRAALGWARVAEVAADPERRPPGRLRAAARFASGNVFSSGAYAADVEIDRGTGRLTVRRLVAVDDAGTLINPLLAHGQVIGGAVQGLGECLVEEAVYDAEGQMRSGSFLDYSLLTAAEIPPILTGEVQTPSPLNPLGAKGAGEGGSVGSLAAVANAVTDALGGCHVDPPYTADKLWRALQ